MAGVAESGSSVHGGQSSAAGTSVGDGVADGVCTGAVVAVGVILGLVEGLGTLGEVEQAVSSNITRTADTTAECLVFMGQR